VLFEIYTHVLSFTVPAMERTSFPFSVCSYYFSVYFMFYVCVLFHGLSMFLLFALL
jgi:hypothetical protein